MSADRALAPPPAEVRRIVYLGTPEVAVPTLRALHAAGFELPLVISQPDRRRGRGSTVSPSPVKAAALELGLTVSDRTADAVDVGADLGVVVAYGRLIKPEVLERLAMVNLHFSLLPRWRGAAPVERALLEGDTTTGVCLMEVAEGLDEGGVYRMAEHTISPTDTLERLRSTLVEIGTGLLLAALENGLGQALPQQGEPLHAAKIDPSELHLDLGQPAAVLDRLVRLGGAWAEFRGKRLRIWSAEVVAGLTDDGAIAPGALMGGVLGTGSGGLLLREVQPEGKQRMAASAWLNGARPTADERLV
ncbi:MAG: methionyl-tRNA formyltransferase [Actinomycetota bacterium]|nr:methionyl-tRNA formyltransferase [Actinomycetota bacterium]